MGKSETLKKIVVKAAGSLVHRNVNNSSNASSSSSSSPSSSSSSSSPSSTETGRETARKPSSLVQVDQALEEDLQPLETNENYCACTQNSSRDDDHNEDDDGGAAESGGSGNAVMENEDETALEAAPPNVFLEAPEGSETTSPIEMHTTCSNCSHSQQLMYEASSELSDATNAVSSLQQEQHQPPVIDETCNEVQMGDSIESHLPSPYGDRQEATTTTTTTTGNPAEPEDAPLAELEAVRGGSEQPRIETALVPEAGASSATEVSLPDALDSVEHAGDEHQDLMENLENVDLATNAVDEKAAASPSSLNAFTDEELNDGDGLPLSTNADDETDIGAADLVAGPTAPTPETRLSYQGEGEVVNVDGSVIMDAAGNFVVLQEPTTTTMTTTTKMEEEVDQNSQRNDDDIGVRDEESALVAGSADVDGVAADVDRVAADVDGVAADSEGVAAAETNALSDGPPSIGPDALEEEISETPNAEITTPAADMETEQQQQQLPPPQQQHQQVIDLSSKTINEEVAADIPEASDMDAAADASDPVIGLSTNAAADATGGANFVPADGAAAGAADDEADATGGANFDPADGAADAEADDALDGAADGVADGAADAEADGAIDDRADGEVMDAANSHSGEEEVVSNEIAKEGESADPSSSDQQDQTPADEQPAVDRDYASSSSSSPSSADDGAAAGSFSANQAEDSMMQSVHSMKTQSTTGSSFATNPADKSPPPLPTIKEGPIAATAGPTKGTENRCGECGGELGRDDQRTIYKQVAYHPRCFTCAECKSEKLSGLNGFYVNGGRRYCVDCYNKNVAERCTGCGEAILEGGVRHRSRPFHHKCFQCNGCHLVLGRTPFVFRDMRTLCLTCYADKFAEKCTKCEKTIQPGEQYLQVEGKRFHDECLICEICEDQLQDSPFVQDGTRNVCVNCSTNGFVSHKLKSGAAAATGANADPASGGANEAAAAASTEASTAASTAKMSEAPRNSSGMDDLKDWISKPASSRDSSSSDSESNRNSAAPIQVFHDSDAVPVSSSNGQADADGNNTNAGEICTYFN